MEICLIRLLLNTIVDTGKGGIKRTKNNAALGIKQYQGPDRFKVIVPSDWRDLELLFWCFLSIWTTTREQQQLKLLLLVQKKLTRCKLPLFGSWLVLPQTPWICRATLCVYHPCFCTVICCFVKPHMACWVWKTLSRAKFELLVGMDYFIFHSSSIMAEICGVLPVAVSCKFLLKMTMISHLKTLKCISYFLLPFKNQSRPILSDMHRNAVSQKLSCIKWAKVNPLVHVLTLQDIQVHL